MKIIRTDIIPFSRRYDAVNLFGVLFVHRASRLTAELANHEAIHTRQMTETLFIPFYVIYLVEWLARLPLNRFNSHRAYHAISFEREAYARMNDLNYLKSRPLFAQWRHSCHRR
jgi:hypothetical protein